MNKLSNDDDAESDPEADPEQLLNEWLGELKTLSGVSFRIMIQCF